MAMTERDRRALIILGVIAGIAVAFFLVTQVLGGGDEETPPAAAPAPADGGTVPEPAPTTASPAPPKSPKEVVNFTGRDPFSTPPELVTASPSATSTDTATPTSTATTTTNKPTAPSGDQSTNVAGKQVTLDTVYTRGNESRVTVEVDGKVYDESVGGTFDRNYEVRSIDTATGCATFLYGDESFRLCSDSPK
jgi:hypothetical protein